MKKHISLRLLIVMACLILSACSKTEESVSEETATEQETTTEMINGSDASEELIIEAVTEMPESVAETESFVFTPDMEEMGTVIRDEKQGLFINGKHLVDADDNYIGFSDVEDIDWKKEELARQEGWVLNKDHTALCGKEELLRFYENCRRGNPGWIRVMSICRDESGEESSYFLTDAFFDGEKYYTVAFQDDEVFWNIQNRIGYRYFYIVDIGSRDDLITRKYVLTDKENPSAENIWNAMWGIGEPINFTWILDEYIYLEPAVASILINGQEMLDKAGCYRELGEINVDAYTREQAEADRCYWTEQITDLQTVVHGKERLEQFYEQCRQGMDGRIRIAEFTEGSTESKATWIGELLYDGENYFWIRNDRKTIYVYKDMYRFEIEEENGTRIQYLLSDANTELTWEIVRENLDVRWEALYLTDYMEEYLWKINMNI